jgi:hypothetical protein
MKRLSALLMFSVLCFAATAKAADVPYNSYDQNGRLVLPPEEAPAPRLVVNPPQADEPYYDQNGKLQIPTPTIKVPETLSAAMTYRGPVTLIIGELKIVLKEGESLTIQPK